MSRRTLVAALCLLLFPLAVAPGAGAPAPRAGKVYRIGLLAPAGASAAPRLLEAFRQGLRELGWVEGRNIVIEPRWAERPERFVELAAELIAREADVIVSAGTAAAAAAGHLTRTIPVVIVGADPVASGLVTSRARPAENVTGLGLTTPELGGAQLGLLKEMVPDLRRVGVLWYSHSLHPRLVLRDAAAAAAAIKVQLLSLEVGVREDFDQVFETALLLSPVDALLTAGDVLTEAHRAAILDFAAMSRLPAIYPSREFVEAGGLMMYGPDLRDLFRRSATYVDRLLDGARPADLPIGQPAKLELVINLQAARALGLTVPASLLLRADDVIE